MAKPLSIVDHVLAGKMDTVTTNIKNVMLFTRQMRTGDYELTPEMLKVVEDFLFCINSDQVELGEKLKARLGEYGELVAECRAAVASLDPVHAPAFKLSNVIVFTGQYRPAPANDAAMPGGAA